MNIRIEGLRLMFDDKYIGNLIVLALLGFFAAVVHPTAVILAAYIIFNLINPGKSSKVRLGKLGVLFIAFIIALAITPTSTTTPQVQQTPTPVSTPVATPVAEEPVVTVNNPCPVCGDEGSYESDYSEGFGKPSYSCNNGHGQLFFTPEAGVYVYWADYTDDYNLDANEMHYY